jgi:hypothetical protein
MHFADSLEDPERCGGRSSSTHSNSRGQSQETRVKIWTSDRGRLILSKGKATEFYELIAQPYHEDQTISLSTQRLVCNISPYNPLEYPVKLLDQLQYGSQQIKLGLFDTETIIALSPQLYTPDKSHPFRGIWIG